MTEKRDGSVQSVERALMLLEALGEDGEGLRLTDLARQCSLSVSTTHRLLTTLQKRRFVEFDRNDGHWQVGRQAFSVGSAFIRHRNFIAVANPYLRDLRDRTRETANLGVLDEGEMVILSQVESREIMRATSRVGGRAPVYATGMGKAILASFPDEAIAGYVPEKSWRKLTERTLAGEKELLAEMARIRAAGYAVDDEEFVTGLRCVAATVFDRAGEALFAISISGLAARVPAERVASVGELVVSTAQAITRALGGFRPASTQELRSVSAGDQL